MAITVSTGTTKGRANDVIGARRVTRVRVTLDTSYPTGGYSFDPKSAVNGGHNGAVSIVKLFPRWVTGATGSTTRRFEYDYTNKKIIGFVTSTGVEIGNAVDVSGVVLDVEVISD